MSTPTLSQTPTGLGNTPMAIIFQMKFQKIFIDRSLYAMDTDI